MLKLITREGCHHCEVLKKTLDFERTPYKELRIGHEVSREDVKSWLEDAGIESRLLPFVFSLDGVLMAGDMFAHNELYTYKRFASPREMIEYLSQPGTYRVRFTRKNGTDKTITGRIESENKDTALTEYDHGISMYDETRDSWNSFRFSSVKDIRRIK